MEKFLPILENCSLFQGLMPSEIEGMLACLGAVTITAGKHQTVLAEGDPATHLGIVLEGQVQIVKEDYYGKRSIIAHAEPGELFAESFACAGVPALPVSAVAARDSRILLIESRRIVSPCSNACGFHRKMIYNLLQVVADKNLAFSQKLEITSRRTTREKLMAYLLAQAKQRGSSFSIPFDRQALADYLGVERSAMSTELGKLRRDGVLECRKNRFTLLKEEQPS